MGKNRKETSRSAGLPALPGARSFNRRLYLGGTLLLVLAIGLVALFHYRDSRPQVLRLRAEQLTAMLNDRATQLNGLIGERVRFGYSLAALGEEMFALKSTALGKLGPNEWERRFESALQSQFKTFPDIVGGGIWYEPFAFDDAREHRGYYIQWVPPVGKERQLQFTMEWSAAEANYHEQDWYRTLIPSGWPARKKLPSQVAWTSPYRDPVTKVLMITVDAAMYSADGHLIGMSTVDWNLNQIEQLIQQIKPTSRARAFLADSASRNFVAVTDASSLALTPVSAVDWGKYFDWAPPAETFTRNEFLLDNEKTWYFSRRLNNNLLFGFTIPESEILAEIVRAQNRQLATLVGSIVLCLIAVLLMSRRVFEEQVKQLSLARDQALELSRMKSEFLANMSHEIRTPMNGVLGMLELAAEHKLDGELQELVTLAQKSAHSLLRIIDDILDFSKIESGKLKLVVDKFSLKDLLESTVRCFEVIASSRAQSVVLHILGDLPQFCLGDEGRIRQVLINLIGNGLKFNHNGGGVALIAEWRNGQARLAVIDSGIGIPGDKLDEIFSPFAQADGSMTRAYGGTGLGLTISRDLIEGMGGEIGVRSLVNTGSVFFLTVPLPAVAEDAGRNLPERSRPASSAAFRKEVNSDGWRRVACKCRILLAEDNQVNQQVIIRLLQRAGHSVVTADNGRQAVDLAEHERFDVVLMDIQMPELDGVEALKELRKKGAWRSKVPIIALTAHASDSDRKTLLEAGFDAHVTKPVDKKALLDTIETLVE